MGDIIVVPGITTSSKGELQSIVTLGAGPDSVVVVSVVVVLVVGNTGVVGEGTGTFAEVIEVYIKLTNLFYHGNHNIIGVQLILL